MSEDSYEARRAMRLAQPRDDVQFEEEEVQELEEANTTRAARPGEEEKDQEGETVLGKRTRPKLTYELLTAPHGIPAVFKTFREAFKSQRTGSQNPVRDLGALIDLYEQWQKQLFPHSDFDGFLKKLSALYGKPGGRATKGATLKSDMRELRHSVVQAALDQVVTRKEADSPGSRDVDHLKNEGAHDIDDHGPGSLREPGAPEMMPAVDRAHQHPESSDGQEENAVEEDFLDLPGNGSDSQDENHVTDDELEDMMV